MTRSICWRIHCASPPEKIFSLWASDEGRERFLCEQSVSTPDGFALTFPDGTQEHCTQIESAAPRHFGFTYFGSRVMVELRDDGCGGTDLLLTNDGVAEADYEEVHAGWLSVLLPLKAVADFGVDLRNHDPARTWQQGFADQ